MSLTKEQAAGKSTTTSMGRRMARAATVLAAGVGIALGTTTAASATDLGPGWAPPVCAPEMQVLPAVVMTAVWYPTGGGYSAGRGYYTFDVKAVTYIAGVEGEPIEGTTYCFPD